MVTYFFSKAVFKIFQSSNTRWKLNKVFPSILFIPHMKRDEYILFKELCRRKKIILEYGSGGSTIYFLKEKKQIFSVESNPDFYNYMISIRLVKRSLDKTLNYRCIDLGITNKWGKPLTAEKNGIWSDYYMKVWKDINPVKDKIDIIFIDGRFRVCCCLYSILKIIEYNWKDTVFIVHDFWRREKYHVLLKFLQEIKSSSNLASFKVKENLNIEEVKDKIQEHKLDIA